MLQSLGSQRVEHDLVTEQQQDPRQFLRALKSERVCFQFMASQVVLA